MWQYVERFGFGVPLAAVEPVAVLGYARQVDDAEERRVARPVGVVGGGFAQVVESGPDEFAHAVGAVVVLDEVVLGQIRPSAVLHVVRRRLVVVVAGHRTAHDREFVDAARADRRGGFAAEDHLLRES